MLLGHVGRVLSLYINILSFAPRAALAAIALGAIGATAAFADTAETTSTTTSSTGTTCTNTASTWKHHHHGDFAALTSDERTQLKKAKEAAFAADPSLETQKEALKAKFEAMKAQNSPMTDADKQALHEQAKTFHDNLRAAELKADPTLAPVLAKIDAAHPHHHHDA